jgi:hypothetical protein
MKNTKSFLGLAALLPAIIALVLTGCPDPNGGGDNPDPTVTSVTVSSTTSIVEQGKDLTFTATVTGDNSPAQTVTWEVSRSDGAVKDDTKFTGAKLTVAGDEPIGTLTVTATSTVDKTKSGTMDVTVYEEGKVPTVTSVTVSPATASVAKGGTATFTATVTGDNSPAQTVTWSVSGDSGTTISAVGSLSVVANESAATLTVTATSTVDTTKSGTAAVTVTDSGPDVPESTIYTITFNSQGGSSVDSQTVTKGGTVPYPAEPAKEGVFFDGWYTESDCTNPCDYTAPVSGPITLYALWLTESEMIAAEFGASVPESNIFEVNNNTATASGQPEWDNSWVKACTAINNGGADKNYIIKVVSNFQLANASSNTFTPDNIKVLIYTPTDKIISSSGSGVLLYAGANQTLILRNIALQGGVYCGGTNARLVMQPGTVVTGRVNVASGTFTMDGGTISGNRFSSSSYYPSDGGGVAVGSSSTFTMSGGIISSNTADSSTTSSYGGGVYVSGTFTMSGGTISGNTAYSSISSDGGGVYVSGTFTMSGGTISGNTASSRSSYGGGVYVGSSGTFTMSGGTISGNTASSGSSGSSASSDGGGVYVSGTFTMNDGTISGNTASASSSASSAPLSYYSDGGGVCVGSSGTFTMNDGTISGNTASSSSPSSSYSARSTGGGVSVSGTFTMSDGIISGNKVSSSASIIPSSSSYGGGVYVSGTFTMGGGTIYGREAGTGLVNTASVGASLSRKDTASIAKYGNSSNIIESGLATNETLVGHN